MSTPTPNKRIALVTGANKGLGFEVARQLGRDHGMTVLLGARDPARGRDAEKRLVDEGLDVRLILLEITDAASVHAAADRIESEHGRLDVLVNNAGVADRADGPPSKADLDAVRRTFEINCVGPLAVTQAMLPLLRKSASARVVNVSSGLGSLTLNGDPGWEFAPVKYIGYNGSKAALNMMTVQLAAELRETRILVNSADPGFTATDMNGHRGTQTVEQGVVAIVRLATLPAGGPTGRYFNDKGELPW